MRVRITVAVVAAVAAATISTTATASTQRHAGTARVDLSTPAAVAGYLHSLGLDSRGFVVQRGSHNYAGPSCPGVGWSCTLARRVLQISTRSTDSNDFVCTPSTSTGPDDCVIVQTGDGGNVAVCIETSGAANRTQTCSITQTSSTGSNTATVRQTLKPHGSSSAAQKATVTQTSTTGANSIDLAQAVAQDDNIGTKSVSMAQTAAQDFELTQSSLSGANAARLAQAVGQTQTAKHATSGSQSQTADLKGHVDQTSTGLSTVTVAQNELQAQSSAGGVAQTQAGPVDCCSAQGTNPGDSFSITQTAQHLQDPGGSSSETESAHFTSTGTGTATQTYNGQTFTQSGHTVNSTTTCSGGECGNVQPPPPTDVYVSVGNGQVNEYHPDGTLVRTLDDGSGAINAGLAFGPNGNLYVTDFSTDNVSVFAPDGSLAGTFGSGYDAHPESIVFNPANGNAFVGQADGAANVLEFTGSGAPVAAFAPQREERGTDWIDLAPDGCTIYYTSEGVGVHRYDTCTSTQLADFGTLPGPNAYAIRLLPGGGALVADSDRIVRMDAGGNVVQTYGQSETTAWFALALDADGSSFWVADLANDVVKHYALSGAELGSFPVSGPPDGIVVGPQMSAPVIG